jgi:hypothetical protein
MYDETLGMPLAANWASLRTKYDTSVWRSRSELFTGVAVSSITFFGYSPHRSLITASARRVFALRRLWASSMMTSA